MTTATVDEIKRLDQNPNEVCQRAARDVAEGIDVDHDHLREVAWKAGWTHEQFTAAVDRWKLRIDAIRDLATAKAMTEEIEAAVAEQRQLEQRVASIRAEWFEKERTARVEAKRAEEEAFALRRQQIETRKAATGVLRQTADPAIQAEIGRLGGRASMLRKKLMDAPKIADLEAALERAKKRLEEFEPGSVDPAAIDARDSYRLLRDSLETARRTYPNVEADRRQLAELETKITRLEAAKLVLDFHVDSE